MPLVSKKYSEYTPSTTLTGTELVPFAVPGSPGSNGVASVTTILNNPSTRTRVSVKTYGAKGDGKRYQYVGITNGANTLGCGQSDFTQADVGKLLIAYQEYPDGTGVGVAFSGTILSVQDSQHVTMSHNAYRGLPGNDSTFIIYGTDDSAAIQAALNAAKPTIPTYIANDANIQLGASYNEVVVPGTSGVNGIYMIGSQVTVPSGIIFDGLGMICNVTGNLATTTPCMIFQDYTICRQLSVEAGYGCGVQFGTSNADQSHTFADNVEIWHSGINVGQYSVYAAGYDVRFGHVYTKGGYYGMYCDSASDLHIDEMFSIGNVIGIYLKGTQQANIVNQFCDSCRGVGLQIDGGAANIYARVHAFAANGTTFTLNPVVSIGQLTTTTNKNIVLDVQANNTGNAVIGIANTKETVINFLASNTQQAYGNNYPIATGVAYGANVDQSVAIRGVLSTGIAPYTGTRNGIYQYTQTSGTYFDVTSIGGGVIVPSPATSSHSLSSFSSNFGLITNRFLDARLTGDANARFVALGDGSLSWGTGVSPRDTTLYRSGVGLLKTDNTLVAATGYQSGLAAPASSSATGVAGTMTWDANYIYVCTATNTWKRVAIATW